MKKCFYMAVAAIAALSSCSNDNEFEQNQIGNQGLVFTATMEGSEGTRATYDRDKKCASWEEGDQISINGVNYSAQTAGTTTTFKATTEGEEATDETYNAYFPASLYNNGTPTLPANVSETWAEGKFNMPMYATSKTTDLAFKNLCGVLKITVTPEQLPNVKCITVSSTNCATSGAFTVSGNAAVLTDASKTANTVTVTYTAAVATDATSKVFYVAIPAQTYKELTIAINDGKATKVMTTKKDQNITVARNKIYPITFNGQLTTGEADVTTAAGITDNKVKWVQLWAGGPKFADRNVDGTMTFTDATATSFIWGSNWCTPSKDQLDELLLAASSAGSEEVTCLYTQESGVYGFKFTGKKTGYTGNSVFFPAQYGDSRLGRAYYWSGTADGGEAWYMYLYYGGGGWGSYWVEGPQGLDYRVRPVLKN